MSKGDLGFVAYSLKEFTENDKNKQRQDDSSSKETTAPDDLQPVSLKAENGKTLTEEDAAAEQQRKEALTERDN